MGANAPITVIYDGTPQAKGRARFGRGHAYTPQSTVGYQYALGWHAKAGMGGRKPITGPVTFTALFELSVPPSWSKARRAAAIAQLCRDGNGRALSPIGAALDLIAQQDRELGP